MAHAGRVGGKAAETPGNKAFTPRSFLYLTVAILLLGAILRLHFFMPELNRSPDERTYTHQVNVLLANGTEGLRLLGQQYIKNPEGYNTEPPPTRVGYLGVLAAFMKITGDTTVWAGEALSLLCSLATLVLVALLAHQALSPRCAVLAALFYAVQPFDLTASRRAWQDSFIAFLAVAILCICVYIGRTTGRRQAAGVATLSMVGALACTTKENLAIYFVLCVAGAAAAAALNKRRRDAITFLGAGFVAVLISAVILAAIFGGIGSYLTIQQYAVHGSPLIPYEMQFNRGPQWMFLLALLRACPVVALATLLAFVVVVSKRMRGGLWSEVGIDLGIALLCAAMLLLQIGTERYNFRYTAPAYGVLCLSGAMGINMVAEYLWPRLVPLGKTAAWSILGFAIAVAALHDFNFAHDTLLSTGMQDLALRPVFGAPPLPLNQAH